MYYYQRWALALFSCFALARKKPKKERGGTKKIKREKAKVPSAKEKRAGLCFFLPLLITLEAWF
jgi:hypothetical protein